MAYPFDAAGTSCVLLRFTAGPVSDDLMVLGARARARTDRGRSSPRSRCVTWGPTGRGPRARPILGFGSPALTAVGRCRTPRRTPCSMRGIRRMPSSTSGIRGVLGGATSYAIVEQFSTTPSTMTAIGFEHFHGAVTPAGDQYRAGPGAVWPCNLRLDGPAGHRGEHRVDPGRVRGDPSTCNCGPSVAQLSRRRRRCFRRDPDGVRTELQRLAEIERRYDPENVFQSNHNIEPTSAA